MKKQWRENVAQDNNFNIKWSKENHLEIKNSKFEAICFDVQFRSV